MVKIMTAITKVVTAMTTNHRIKRDRHPARSARILTTGLAVASTLGISTALTLASQASAKNDAVNTPTLDPALVAAGTVTPTAPTAPTSPSAPTTPSAPSSAAPATPVVTAATAAPQVVQVPVAPQVFWTPPATSGSH